MGKFQGAEWCPNGCRGFRISWPYVAGFFDGEGCIFRNHVEGRLTADYRVTIVQSETVVLEGIRQFLLENGIDSRIVVRKKPNHSINSKRGNFALIIYRRNCVESFLRSVVPYLWVKRLAVQDGLRILTIYKGIRGYKPFRQQQARKMVEARKTSPAWIAACERRRKHNRADILAMRTSGIPAKEIAARIGVTETRAYKLIRLARQQGG